MIPGAYEGVGGYPFQDPSQPGLRAGASLGCGKPVSGRFDILENEVGSDGEVERFAVDFEQQCYGAEAALFGASRFNASLPPIPVDIDIMPDGDFNPINLNSQGVVPVAILGSDAFHVADVDTATLAFGPGGAAPTHKQGGHFEDVDEDGLTDLVSHYRAQESGIEAGDVEACVRGETFNGISFEGCDFVSIVSGCGLGFELAFLLPPLMGFYARRITAAASRSG